MRNKQLINKMNIKTLTTSILFTLLFIVGNSQTVNYQSKEYKVKGETIYLLGEDVTHTIADEDKDYLYKLALEQRTQQDDQDKKAKKAAKKEEKKLKKKEKELKKKENALEDHEDAVEKLEKTQAKYEKLKRKGKLSPNDEIKWLDKIAKLKEKVAKKKRKI